MNYRNFRAFRVRDDEAAFEAVADEVLPPDDRSLWNIAIMELGGVACETVPACDDAACPWREWCAAYRTGDFPAPDVPTPPAFEGSRRQFRGRILRTNGEHDELPLDDLGHRIRVDYTPDGDHGREWLRGLVADLREDGLLEVEDGDGASVVRLHE